MFSIDVDGRTAEVGGMTTYEDLVAATLPHGLMPLVVPQLKTITLGGAVTGLGIESSSFRVGCPHESVLEMDILTGSGEVVTAAPDNRHRDLFYGFCNSYGSLGYALRLKIELQPVRAFVHLRHLAFTDVDTAMAAMGQAVTDGSWAGETVDFIDGTWFSGTEVYVSLGSFSDTAGAVSDYTDQDIYYRSIQAEARGLADHRGLHLALGHRLVLVLPRVRCAESARPSGMAQALPALGLLLEVDRPQPALRDLAERIQTRATGRRGASRTIIQDVEVPVERLA